MKLLICGLAIFFAFSAKADDQEIDWSQVLPPMEVPGFWDGKAPELKKLYYSGGRVGRIVGGQEVTPHSIPYQVALLMVNDADRSTICGGSVITTRTVMTAAHCVHVSVTVQIILGAHNYRTVEPSQQRQTITAANVRIHELYNHSNLDEDIGLLYLERPAEFNEFVQPIAIPWEFADELFVDEEATISGWGRTSDIGQQGSAVLLAVTVPVMTNEACAARFTGGISDRRLCASGIFGRGSCFGDSGGPLTVERSGRLVQIGISSFVALAGCEIGFPSGYTRVTSYLDWLSANVRD